MNEFTNNTFGYFSKNDNGDNINNLNLNLIYNSYLNYLSQFFNTPNYLAILNNFKAMNAQNNINLLVNLNASTQIIDKSCNNINIINNFNFEKGESVKRNFQNPQKVENINAIYEECDVDDGKKASNAMTGKVLNKKRGRGEDMKKDVKHVSNPRRGSSNLSYNLLEEHEMKLIDSIDKPKKKKNTHHELHEKTKLKLALQKYSPNFSTDLATTLRNPVHGFMKSNFPKMYELENYYLYIKQVSERRQNKLKHLISEVDSRIKRLRRTDQKQEPTTYKKVWDPSIISSREGKPTITLVEEFLFKVEKVWPIDNYIWSQEVVLEILAENGYDYVSSFEFIKSRDSMFIEILDSKYQ
jgi:hypothetical protein